MSFRGGGRGGFGRGGKQRIGGQEVGWDYDPEIEKAITAQPSDVFPPMENLPTLNPPMAAERESIGLLLELRERIRKGPLYTVQGNDFRVGKKARAPAAARFDPFEGMRSYSFKYKPPQKSLADFTTRKYPTKFFPDELLGVFDPLQAAKKPRTRAKQPVDVASRLKDINDNDEEENEDANEDAEVRDADEEAEQEDDVDDDFEDDESDMGSDYNAEKYFDDGENDEADMDGGADDGGDYE